MMRYFIFAALAISGGLCSTGGPCKSSPCTIVNVYYESLGPASKALFKNQLVPGYSGLRDYLIINLFPFGNATIKVDEANKTVVTCQHGPTECKENIAHACAMEVIHEEETPLETKHYQSMAVIGCAMGSDEPTTIQQCAERAGLSEGARMNMTKCEESGFGEKLLIVYGQSTQRDNPKHADIPMITVRKQGSMKTRPASKLLSNFKKYICDRIPIKRRPIICI